MDGKPCTANDKTQMEKDCFWSTLVMQSTRIESLTSHKWTQEKSDLLKEQAVNAFHDARKVLEMRQTQGHPKVIFLDLEGVLNNNLNWKDCQPVGNTSLKIHPLILGRVKAIMDATDAKLILSPSFRWFENKQAISEFVAENGIDPEDILDAVPTIGWDRKKEYSQYFENHPEIKAYVIIDDGYHIDDYRVIRPEWKTGMTTQDAVRAIEILSAQDA